MLFCMLAKDVQKVVVVVLVVVVAIMGVIVLRAIHAGKRVVIVQFLKNSATGEIYLLEQLGAKVYRGKCGDKFLSGMTEEEKAATKKMQTENLY